jgi:hypothetical protein
LIFHVILLLLKMALDVRCGDFISETVESTLGSLLSYFTATEQLELISLIAKCVPTIVLQPQFLDHLPISIPSLVLFRQHLAQEFLSIPPSSPPSVFLDRLKFHPPFTEIQRDLSNTHAIQIAAATTVFDIAIGHPAWSERKMTKEIVNYIHGMSSRIIDGAAFVERSETKEVLTRLWMRLHHGINPGRTNLTMDAYLTT